MHFDFSSIPAGGLRLDHAPITSAALGMVWGAALGEHYRGGIAPFATHPLTDGMIEAATVVAHQPSLTYGDGQLPSMHLLEAIAIGFRFWAHDPQKAVYMAPYAHEDLRIGLLRVGLAAAFLVRHHRQDFKDEDFAATAQCWPPNGSVPIETEERLAFVFAVFLRHRHDPRAAMRTLYTDVELADRRMLALMGSLCGIYHGLQGLPPEWLAQCADGSRLTTAALELAKGVGDQPAPKPTWPGTPASESHEASIDEAFEDEEADGDDDLAMIADRAPRAEIRQTLLTAGAHLDAGRFEQAIDAFREGGEALKASGSVMLLNELAEFLVGVGDVLYDEDLYQVAAGFLMMGYEDFSNEVMPPGHIMAYAGQIASGGYWTRGLWLLQKLLNDLDAGTVDANNPYAEDDLDEEVEETPWDNDWLRAAIYLTMGNICGDADDVEGAVNAYQKCFEVASTPPDDPDTTHQAAALWGIGNLYRLKGRYAEAIPYMERSFEYERDSDLLPFYEDAKLKLAQAAQSESGPYSIKFMENLHTKWSYEGELDSDP